MRRVFSTMMITLLIAIGSAIRAIHQQNLPSYRHAMGQPLQVLIGARCGYFLLCQRYIELNTRAREEWWMISLIIAGAATGRMGLAKATRC